MLNAPLATVVAVAARLQDVVETDEVALNVGIGIGDGVAHARLGCEVYHHLKVVLGKKFVDECLVGKIALYEHPLALGVGGGELRKTLQAILLDAHIVVVVDAIETHNLNGLLVVSSRSTRLEPMKPAAPVTKTFIYA